MSPQPAPVESPSAAPIWRRATRSAADRQVAGVCIGIARRVGVDPLLVRALAVVLALSAGAGVVSYAAAWLLMPDESGTSVADRHAPGVAGWRTGMIVAAILTVYLVTLPLWTSITPFSVGPLFVIGGLAWLARRASGRSSTPLPRTSAATGPPTVDQGSPARPAPVTPVAPGFDPYRAAPAVVARGRTPSAGRPHRSWWLTLAMVMAASAVAAIVMGSPVNRPLLLGLAAALGVIGAFELVGTVTRRPHLGPLLGIIVAASLAFTVAAPALELPTRVITEQSATSIWDNTSDLRGGVTVAGPSARIDASDLSLDQDARTTIAVLGGDVGLVTPAGENIVVTADIRGGTVTAPDGRRFDSGQTTVWQRTRTLGEPTLTVHLQVYGGRVQLVNPS